MQADEIDKALQAFPEARAIADPFLQAWAAGKKRFSMPGLEAEVIQGDARVTMTDWDGLAAAWFLDGFSPAKNPEIWDDALMAQVGKHTVPGGSFATYTAAGFVRRALTEAGFEVERRSGFGRKRHMSCGRKL